MKTVQELNHRKVPIVRINPSLDEYRDKVIFPEKLEKVNEMLKTVKLPKKKNIGYSTKLNVLTKLNFFNCGFLKFSS